MWIEPYLSHSLNKSFQIMVSAVRSPMQWRPSNRKLSIRLTGNEINNTYNNMKLDWWTLNLVLFCDTFEFGAAICRLSLEGIVLWRSFLKQNTGSGSWWFWRKKSEIVNMTAIHHLPPFCAFQTLIFLEHSAENYVPCLVVTFSSDPCALEMTLLHDWEILPSTTACHINLETFMIIYKYTFLDYI